jgi:hypothetical protein
MKPHALPCDWHRTGVPKFAQSMNWCKLGCPICNAKVLAGDVTADAPTPEQFARVHRYPHVDHVKKRAQNAARKACYLGPMKGAST